ncbi:hypothetical protein ACFSJY_17720 [Thalassotalea euphylliae]|uniref:hypothetical protein n=1 Tax=Thalassotalea euphylliae TaxID=1655234 RepID=UPI003634A5E0
MGLTSLPNKQQGVVLVVALVFLISLTAVASALMLNSTTDLKIAGASEQKLIAVQEAISATDEAIADQVTSDTNLFTRQTFPFDITTINSVTVDTVRVTSRNFDTALPDCPHSKLASSTKVVKCNVLNLGVTNNYGRKDTSSVVINAGISQQILNVGN